MSHGRRLNVAAMAVMLVVSSLIALPFGVTPAGAAPISGAGRGAGGLLTNGSFEGSLAGWSGLGFQASTYNDLSQVHDGQWVANGFATTASGSLFQDVPVSGVGAGQSFVGSIWVHSADATPFSGSLVLWGLGTSDVGVTYFSVGSQWTRIQVPLDVRSGSLTGIRFQMYASTLGHNITFDGAELSASLLTNGSFEGSLAGWSGLGFQASTYNDLSQVHDGQWVANGFATTASGSLFQDVPVSGVGAGQSFVGSIWVHSADATPFSGSLVLWGLGTSDVGVTYFSVGSQWTRIQVPLDVRSGSLTGIRFQMYASTLGHNITFDGAELSASLLTNGSFEGSLAGWSGLGFQASTYNDLSQVHDGQWVANGFATTASGSLFQDVPVSGVGAGQSFVGSIWVHSADATPFSGSLVLWGLGTSDVGVTYFSVGSQWTRIQVPLDVRSGSLTGIRFQMYASTLGHNITFDGAQLSGPPATGGVLAARAAATSAYARSRSGVVGFTLIDTATGGMYAGGSPDASIRTASVIKVPIAMALIAMANRQGRGLTAAEQSDLHFMITQSDNNAATRLWNDVGGTNAVVGLMRSLGATNTHADPGSPEAWGFTWTTSRDLATVLAKLAGGVLGSSGTDLILSQMHQVVPAQAWGIDAAVPGSAVKNGWFPDPSEWRVNCLGIVAGTRYALAVMTRYPIGLGQGYGEQTCQGVASGLFNGPNAAAPRLAAPMAPAAPGAVPAITGIGMTADGG